VSNPLPPGATGTDQTFAPALLGTFRDGVGVLEQGIQQIKDAWNGLVNAVNGFIQRVNDYLDNRHFWQKPFDWLFDDLQEGCEKIKAVILQVQEKVNSVLDTVQKSVNGSIPVFSLFEVGMDWGTKVKAPLSDIGPDLSPSGKIDSWRGPAHETYKTRVQDQFESRLRGHRPGRFFDPQLSRQPGEPPGRSGRPDQRAGQRVRRSHRASSGSVAAGGQRMRGR